MAIDTSKSLVEALERVPLLSAAQQAALAGELLPGCNDPQALARQLLQRGWLTPYQLNRLMLGRAGELIVGPYILLERLGEGGAGEVFKARHQHMSRVVALKLVRRDALADKETVGRFQREVHALAQLEHPNVIHAYDAGPAGNNFFLAMEYIEGVDLQRLVRQKGPLDIRQACDYVRQAAAGLQYIHERGMVHRDIKPSNLMVVSGQVVSGEWSKNATSTDHHSPLTTHHSPLATHQVKILDLGLARIHQPIDSSLTGGLTGTGAVAIGTLDYMAPEQALDFHTADIRSDIYSLGCTFYFLLVGRAPFGGRTAAQILLAHQQKEPAPLAEVRPESPAEISLILRRMMAKPPGERFQTPQEVEAALNGLLRGDPVTTRTSRFGSLTGGIEADRTQLRPFRRVGVWLRRPFLAATGAAVLLALCLVALVGSRSSRPASSRTVAPVTPTEIQPPPGPRAYLLHVDKGERTNDSEGNIVPQIVDSPWLGSKAMKVVFRGKEYIGTSAKVRNWKPFALLRMEILNPSKEIVNLTLTIRHARSTGYQTWIVLNIPLKNGKNELRFPIDKLANVNGTAPDLANVTRWYFAYGDNQPVTLLFGNIWLQGNSTKGS